jgi:hypothetical protein
MQIKMHGQYEYDKDFSQRLGLEFTAAYSDKSTYHGYEDVYSHLLAHRSPKSFLEIGLFLKDSQATDLFAWEKMFPNADIYGADIKSLYLFNRDRIKTFFVDQSDEKTILGLKTLLPEKIDIILDDASHIYELTIKTFENMFDLVADGGIYMIEDILYGNYNMDSYEQRASQLIEYFDKTGLNYDIFATSKIETCVDSIVLAVYR